MADTTPLTDTDNDAPHIRPFADWLREQAAGATHAELGDNLHDLISRVQDTGKKGTLTLTITVAPVKGDDQMVVVSDEIKARLPEHDRKAPLFFIDDHGNLARRDPRQLDFDSLRDVSAPTTDHTNLKDAR